MVTFVINTLSQDKLSEGLKRHYARLQGKSKMPRAVLLEKHKAIYVPIPKVACTSLLIACSELLEMKKTPDLSSVHETYFPCCKGFGEQAKYRNYFKFAFVRNPWDRLVSCYGNKIKQDPNFNDHWFKNGVSRGLSKYDGAFKAGMSFEEFAYIVADIPDMEAEKHFRSQNTFICDKAGEISVNFIGKFENLNEDLNSVFNNIGLESREIPHVQKSSRKVYREYYSESLKSRISDRYEKDIFLFNYSF